MAFVSTGTQYEVGNFQVVFHEDEDVEVIIDTVIGKIEQEFADYTQYRIVDVKHRRDGAQRILVQDAGLEPLRETKLVETLADHFREMVKRNFSPAVFEIRLFVSYDEPKL